jgi:hypothetical protein
MATFSARHYEVLAKAFKDYQEERSYTKASTTADAFHGFAQFLTLIFEEDNNLFNYDRFMKAAGLQYGEEK